MIFYHLYSTIDTKFELKHTPNLQQEFYYASLVNFLQKFFMFRHSHFKWLSFALECVTDKTSPFSNNNPNNFC